MKTPLINGKKLSLLTQRGTFASAFHRMLLVCGFVLCTLQLLAQTDPPKLTLPAPSAFSFTKYGDLPIGLFTGTMNYSIPLMTIESGKIAIPVSIDYASNGIKVNEVSGRSGMGWNLRAGGLITRTIMGKADEILHLFLPSTDDTSQYAFFSFLKNAAENNANTQPDEYTYSFMGYNGKFYFDSAGNIKQLTQAGIRIEAFDTLLSFRLTTPDGSQYYFGGLGAIDETDSYNMFTDNSSLNTAGRGGKTAWHLTKIKHPSGDSVLFNYSPTGGSGDVAVDYPSAVEQSFTVPGGTSDPVSDIFIMGPECIGSGFSPLSWAIGEYTPNTSPCTESGLHTQFTASTAATVKLESIIFKQGTLRFYYSNRDDLPGEKKIDSVVLYSMDGRVKKAFFGYAYTTAPSTYNTPSNYSYYPFIGTSMSEQYPFLKKRLFLDEVRFVSVNDENNKQSYSFEYEGRESLPPRLSFAQDAFGFFNGKANPFFYHDNTFFNDFIGGSFGSSGIRDVDTTFSKKGTLTRINYPTGGFTKVNYESNYIWAIDRKIYDTVTLEITDPSTTPLVYSNYFASKRPYSILVTASYVTPYVYDPMAPVVDTSVLISILDSATNACLSRCETVVNPGDPYKRYYSYIRGAEDRTVRLKLETSNSNVKATVQFVYYRYDTTQYDKPSGGVRVGSLESYTSDGVLASRKRLFYHDTLLMKSSGKLINQFSDARDFAGIKWTRCSDTESPTANYVLYSSGGLGAFANDYMSVNYEHVTEASDSAGSTGLIHTRFAIAANQPASPLACRQGQIMGEFTPYLSRGAPYSNTGILNGKELVKSIYKKSGGSFIKIKETRNYFSVDSQLLNRDHYYVVERPMISPVGVATKAYHDFIVNVYYRTGTWTHLDSTIQKDYDDNSRVLTSKTEYKYDNANHLQTTRVKTLRSNGDLFTSATQYAHDLSLSSLVSRNFIAVPIQFRDSVNNVQVAQRKNNYTFWGDRIAPDMIQQAKGTHALDTNLVFLNYDALGNPLEFTQLGQPGSLLFDTALNVMVAGCRNAAYASIAASSFETGYTGNWDYSGTPTTAYGAITGSKAYLLDGANIERTALNTGTTYTLSYWLKDNGGSVSINSASSGPPLITRNGWKLYQKDITGITQLTLSGSNTAVIDELRLYPKNAQMTTYTYYPMIGIATQCDLNNQIIYYEYDGFGRLIRIRDQDQNILKTYNYVVKELL